MQALRPIVARHIQLLGGLTYEAKTDAAKSYSDATLGKASFVHQETPDINSLFRTVKFCDFYKRKGHDLLECRDRTKNPTKGPLQNNKQGDEDKKNKTDSKTNDACSIFKKHGRNSENFFFKDGTYNRPNKMQNPNKGSNSSNTTF